MAELATSTISSSNIRVKWNEKYLSEGIVAYGGIMSPGLYRGGELSTYNPSAPDKRIKISVGSDDTAVLYVDPDSKYATMIRLTEDVVIDMSGEFTDGGAIPSDVTWYVGVVAEYASNVDTTANIIVTDAVVDGMVKLGVINMLAGDTVIEEDRIDLSGDNVTVPPTRGGVIVPRVRKITLNNTYIFQLSGRIFARGISATDIGPYDFTSKLMRFSDTKGKPLFLDNEYVFLYGLYVPGGGLIDNDDLDENGCYTDPYVRMAIPSLNLPSYTGDMLVHYHEYMTVDDLMDGTEEDVYSTFPTVITYDVYAEALRLTLPVSDNESAISAGSMHEVLRNLWNQLRSKMTHTFDSKDEWGVAWRCQGATGFDGDVYVYQKNGGWAVHSTFNRFLIDGNGDFATSGPSGVIAIDNGVFYEMYKAEEAVSSEPNTTSIYSPVGWTSYRKSEGATHKNYGYIREADSIYRNFESDIGPSGVKLTEDINDPDPYSSIITFDSYVEPEGMSFASGLTVNDGTATGGISRGRPIEIDISSGITWSDHASGLAIYKTGGSNIVLDGFQWDESYNPVFSAAVRQWQLPGSDNAVTTNAYVGMIRTGGGEYQVQDIFIFGIPSLLNAYGTRKLILWVETSKHYSGNY